MIKVANVQSCIKTASDLNKNDMQRVIYYLKSINYCDTSRVDIIHNMWKGK
jgi:hypothetical protein